MIALSTANANTNTTLFYPEGVNPDDYPGHISIIVKMMSTTSFQGNRKLHWGANLLPLVMFNHITGKQTRFIAGQKEQLVLSVSAPLYQLEEQEQEGSESFEFEGKRWTPFSPAPDADGYVRTLSNLRTLSADSIPQEKYLLHFQGAPYKLLENGTWGKLRYEMVRGRIKQFSFILPYLNDNNFAWSQPERWRGESVLAQPEQGLNVLIEAFNQSQESQEAEVEA